jgi:DNA primase
MAGRIPQSFVDELLARTDIVEVVDSRVRLKKAGKNYSACCPFHSEKTPSFTVSAQKQFYYCFGCGASGNAVGFVMEHDSLSFPEAVEALAQQAGLEVPTDSLQSEASKTAEDARQRCYHLLEQSADFYARQLREHPFRDTAVQYLKQRGLSGQVAKTYHMGVSAPGWDNLIQRFSTEGSLTDDVRKVLLDAGLVIEKDSHRLYDRFRGRIMFPIRDVRGRVLGFGARTLGDDKPKYLNSPESLVFHKGSELYGLYECRRSRAPVHRILVTEGYMDVVALAQHGIHYGVATLGTATSKEHLQRLFKFVPEVYFCFDGDDAGRRAAEKAAEQALPFMEDGRQLRFLFLPEHEDPDTLIRQEGREAFERRMERQSLSLGDYLFRLHAEQVNEHSLEGKARLSHLMMPQIQQLPEGIFKQLMLDRLADRVGVAVSDLKARPVAVSSSRQETAPRQDTAPKQDTRQSVDDEPSDNPADNPVDSRALNHRPSTIIINESAR